MRNYVDDPSKLAGMTYGVEIETEGISRAKAAKTVQTVVGGEVRYTGGSYDTWTCVAADGRKWNCSYDGSLAGGGCEVITPVLTIEDMDTLQEVIRALRRAGAKVSEHCGSHVHVGAKQMTPVQIKNLVKLFYKNEELIYKMCKVRAERLGHYTRPLDRAFVDKICDMKNPTMEKINQEWFWHDGHGRYVQTHTHYTNCRYRALNLCNLWDDSHGAAKGTVEFRLFEGTLHAGQIRTNVTLALMLVKKAIEAKAGTIRDPYAFDPATAKFYGRCFLQNLGMVGEYTKVPRKFLIGHFDGDAGRLAKKETEGVAA